MKTALVYGSTTGSTRAAAQSIAAQLGREVIHDVIDIGVAGPMALEGYDLLLVGASTWHIGELQHDWADAEGALAGLDLRGTRIALFGLGDQAEYGETFLDAMGLLYDRLTERGALGGFGFWPTDGYEFTASRALRDDRFCGLALDDDNQRGRTPDRIRAWCRQITAELELAAPLRRAG